MKVGVTLTDNPDGTVQVAVHALEGAFAEKEKGELPTLAEQFTAAFLALVQKPAPKEPAKKSRAQRRKEHRGGRP